MSLACLLSMHKLRSECARFVISYITAMTGATSLHCERRSLEGNVKFARAFAGLVALLALSGFSFAQNPDLKAATDAAQQWLALVDAGQYAESWNNTAGFFQEKVTKPDWEKTMASGRAPFGKLESRQFKSANYETRLPNAPAGKYFVLQYRTKFANSPALIETVTPMQDKDGRWKVSGYYIRPAD